jgi:hypothetical protein
LKQYVIRKSNIAQGKAILLREKAIMLRGRQ